MLDPATGQLVDADDARHAAAGSAATRSRPSCSTLLQPRYERNGDLTRALHVARMRCTLPFEDTSDAEQRLRSVTARLN